MISMSSVVIAAWRVRLYWIDRRLIMSPALRVALSIAVICDAVEAGLVLEQSAIDLHRDVARQEVGEDLLLVRLILDRGRRRLRLAARAVIGSAGATGMICSTVGSCTSVERKFA